MVVGERLFARPDPDTTLDAVLRAEIPRPSSRRAEVPAKLEEVVMRALERDQAARWPSAGEMLAALNRFVYALDEAETPGPRDVAALVAKFCPPETRRLPTHLEAAAQEAAAGADEPAPAGPRTAVLPRDRAEPQGKRPHRHQTFATHVELQGLLELAQTPAKGPTTAVIARPDPDGDDDDEHPDPVAMAEEEAARAKARPITNPSRSQPRLRYVEERIEPEPIEPEVETPEMRRGQIAPKFTLPREPPSRPMLVVAGLLALAVGGGAIAMFFHTRGTIQLDDAPAAPRDAAVPAVVPTPDAPSDSEPVPVPDAAPPPDAAITIVRPPPPRIDAGVALARPDAAAVVGTATLRFGADPWAEVFVDGKSIGRTPIAAVPVAAGHHTIELVYSPENAPSRKQTFAVDVAAGETKPLFAQF
jgi:serine/threonine-protein kinase